MIKRLYASLKDKRNDVEDTKELQEFRAREFGIGDVEGQGTNDSMEIDEKIYDELQLSPVNSFEGIILSPQSSLNATISNNILSPITSIESYSQPTPTISNTYEETSRLTSLTDLPNEILIKIIEMVYYDSIFDEEFDSINKILENFMKIQLLNKFFHNLSFKFLYKYGIFNRPHSFAKFLSNLNSNLERGKNLGKYVQVIDFDSFTSIGLGRTGKMNQEIQMVTSRTILDCLHKTPNLIEFLASENIQDDVNVDVLSYLFNDLNYLQGLDFCGASSKDFFDAFNDLTINRNLKKLFKISFHDCSNLSIEVFKKILPHLINLRRLDLTHTSITSTILLNYLPSTCNLTHLSLSRCSKLTTRDLINFLINHPSVNNHQLQWLNLSIDSNVISPLTSNYLFFTLNHMNAANLQYLNLKGYPINDKILNLINLKFKNLVTLSIGYSNLQFDQIWDFLVNADNLLNIDLSGCKLSKSNILNLITLPNLISIEFDGKVLKDLTNNHGQFIKNFDDPENKIIWRFFDNNGRRSWIYKLFPDQLEYKQILQFGKILNLNLTYYDLVTGEKIVNKLSKPIFLKYVGKKINCSAGFKNMNDCKHKEYLNNYEVESVWPTQFCERGIYNYYSLNI